MRKLKFVSAALIIIYLILLLPESDTVKIELADRAQFVWNRDSLWHALEEHFNTARQYGCDKLSGQINTSLNELSGTINSADNVNLKPGNEVFENLLNKFFRAAPLIGACPDSALRYIQLISRMRQAVKKQSVSWNPDEPAARNIMYKLIYGGRAAVEEVMLQSDKNNILPLIYGTDEPSATPFTSFLGVKIHSGDILVSRGGAPTSALISRGSDYPGNFSHVALVYVDSATNIPSIIEAHIEKGVAVSSLDDYIKDKKLRVMVLRLRSDLPALRTDPMLPHKAAKASLDRALSRHIPYDFEMDYNDDSKLFCSEVASSVYKNLGLNLWTGKSTISSMGTAELLAGFGVRNFETQEPSDLEYDPQLSVVAEWRDMETLYKDHIDNAVVDAILEWTEEGNKIEIEWYLLPVVRTMKLYSEILNKLEKVGPVPEGMSPASALRHEAFKSLHSDIKSYVTAKAAFFRNANGYMPPYWRILQFARDYLKEKNTQN